MIQPLDIRDHSAQLPPVATDTVATRCGNRSKHAPKARWRNPSAFFYGRAQREAFGPAALRALRFSTPLLPGHQCGNCRSGSLEHERQTMTNTDAHTDYVRPTPRDYPWCLTDEAWLRLRQVTDGLRALSILCDPVVPGTRPDLSETELAALFAIFADQLELATADHRHGLEFTK